MPFKRLLREASRSWLFHAACIHLWKFRNVYSCQNDCLSSHIAVCKVLQRRQCALQPGKHGFSIAFRVFVDKTIAFLGVKHLRATNYRIPTNSYHLWRAPHSLLSWNLGLLPLGMKALYTRVGMSFQRRKEYTYNCSGACSRLQTTDMDLACWKTRHLAKWTFWIRRRM